MILQQKTGGATKETEASKQAIKRKSDIDVSNKPEAKKQKVEGGESRFLGLTKSNPENV